MSLSAEQSRLIRQTWASAACTGIVRSSAGETQTSSRPRFRRNRRGGAAKPDSANITSASTTLSNPATTDNSPFFGHLKKIEKVCKTVDERMWKRKVQNEWSTRMLSTTSRLRDEEDLNYKTNTCMRGERSPRNDNADLAQMNDAFTFHNDDDNDRLGLGMPQSDRDSESMELEVPTSQSQERYLSNSPGRISR